MATNFAVRADEGKGYFAISGKRQSSAVTKLVEKATTWATREEAEAALPAIAEAAPGFFGEKQNAVVVDLTPVVKTVAPGATAPAGDYVECLECGSRFPSYRAHLVDSHGMGCVRCNH